MHAEASCRCGSGVAQSDLTGLGPRLGEAAEPFSWITSSAAATMTSRFPTTVILLVGTLTKILAQALSTRAMEMASMPATSQSMRLGRLSWSATTDDSCAVARLSCVDDDGRCRSLSLDAIRLVTRTEDTARPTAIEATLDHRRRQPLVPVIPVPLRSRPPPAPRSHEPAPNSPPCPAPPLI